jgi:hypothetical protein
VKTSNELLCLKSLRGSSVPCRLFQPAGNLPYKPNELVARYVAGLLEPLGETMAGK